MPAYKRVSMPPLSVLLVILACTLCLKLADLKVCSPRAPRDENLSLCSPRSSWMCFENWTTGLYAEEHSAMLSWSSYDVILLERIPRAEREEECYSSIQAKGSIIIQGLNSVKAGKQASSQLLSLCNMVCKLPCSTNKEPRCKREVLCRALYVCFRWSRSNDAATVWGWRGHAQCNGQ